MTELILAHGASGNAASMAPWVSALSELKVDTLAIDLPKGKAERALPAYRAALEQHPQAVIGGHSFGGRVASLLAAQQPVRALLLLSYPLHRPGHPEELRTQHWPDITYPVLVLSGESDPFARVDLLRQEVPKLCAGELHTYPRVGHGLLPVIDDACRRIAVLIDSTRLLLK